MRYVATIGFFDGVHSGHRFVLSELCRVAKEKNLSSMAVSFIHHPRIVLHTTASDAGFLLTTSIERQHMLEQLVDRVLMLDFAQIHAMTAHEFMCFLHQKYDIDILLMGYDHRFGSDMPQTYAEYKQMSKKTGLKLMQMAEYQDDGEHVSSTAIRRKLLSGDISQANSMLGYPYQLTGKVVAGKQIGRMIGFPTANIEMERQKLIPMDGVYAVFVEIDDKKYKGILNIGNNPTVGGNERTLEVHVVDFDGELYDKTIAISLLSFIREERCFQSVEELKQQITNDLQNLRDI